MLWIYVAALVAGGGILALQMIFSHDSDVDADGHADAPADDMGDAALLPMVTSARFWTFGALAFGVFGTLATVLGTSSGLVLPIAIALGAASGFLASFVVRKLAGRGAATRTAVASAVGQIGRVVIALEAGRLGKVRLQLGADMVDLSARAAEPIGEGEKVVVESLEAGIATVSRAPTELLLGS